jgi:hypothetical protein
MAYIEENLTVRGRPRDEDDTNAGPADPQEALYRIADRWKVDKQKPTPDDGSVTNSLTMLTAIPEVDLGMECVLLSGLSAAAPDHNFTVPDSRTSRRRKKPRGSWRKADRSPARK